MAKYHAGPPGWGMGRDKKYITIQTLSCYEIWSHLYIMPSVLADLHSQPK